MTPNYTTYKYAANERGLIFVWKVTDDGTEYLFSCDRVVHDGYEVTADDLESEREVTSADMTVSKMGGATTLTFKDSVPSPSA